VIKRFNNNARRNSMDKIDNFILASKEVLEDPGCIDFFKKVYRLEKIIKEANEDVR